ncbi:MAG: nitroreductase family protein [Tissierellia bacterium]|nr:nitroreductase family protein [Tissierellia bacterium]
MFEQLMEKRRSIRHFTEEEVSKEDLEKILKAGLLAPTAKNRKPIDLIVIQDKEMLEQLSKMKKTGGQFLANCPVGIAVVGNTEKAKETYVEDASIAATFIQLQVTDLGLGSCWGNVIGSYHEDGRSTGEVVKELLKLPDHYEAVAIIGLGHIGKEPGNLPPFNWKEQVHYEKMED